MKILVVTPKYYPDNFSITPLVNSFINEGHKVTVLTSLPFDKNGNYLEEYLHKEEEILGNLKIVRLKAITRKKSRFSIALNYLSFYFKSKKWVKKSHSHFDVVYTFEVSPVTVIKAGNIYKKKNNVKHVVHVLDIWPESLLASGYFKKNYPSYKIMRHWSKKLYSDADELLVGSPSFKEYLENDLGINNVPIRYVSQPGLVSEVKNPSSPYEKGTINILYCGNISSIQLVNYIVPAMNKINDDRIHFYIIGEGRYSSSLKKEIESSINKDRIHFLGEMRNDEVYNYHLFADAIFVGLDNRTLVGKTIPNKLISALYYGRPIIGMLNGDGEKILLESRGGILIEQNEDAFVKAIEKVANMNEKEKNVLGFNNRNYYNLEFNIENIKKEILLSLSRK